MYDLFICQEAGIEIEPMGDLNTEAEKQLGRLVKEKYVGVYFTCITISLSSFSKTFFLLFIGMAQNFSFYIGILWPYALSTPCLVMMTLLTATRSMSSFEVGVKLFSHIKHCKKKFIGL
jgi:aspartyl-tRNA synthetase